MNATRMSPGRLVVTLRWVARGLATALLLFWGAFFVAHLSWFAQPDQLPPLWVFLTMGLHLLMLAGLLVGWRWEVPGALLVLAAAVPFFWVSAGPNFFLFTAVTSLPAVLWLTAGLAEWRGKTAGPTP
jgi:hypothetical protein